MAELTPELQQLINDGDTDALAAQIQSMHDQSEHMLGVMQMNMVQQQMYHKLLGEVFLHHQDCDDCVDMMRQILHIIAHNIEQIDAMLPDDERVGIELLDD